MDLTGKIIVSMPSLEDERFFKTVIYMCAHSSEGSMGIIINKKIDYDLYPDLLEQLGIDKPLENKKFFIRYGGPVESGRGYAGWSPGQLEKEIIHNSWMTLSVDSSFLFDEEVSKKWNQAYKLIGIDPNNLSQFSGRA